MSLRSLPPPARRLLLATIAGGAVLAAAAVLQSGAAPDPMLVTMLAAGVALGEALRIDLSYRAGGNATFGLSDAALTAGLLVMSGTDVVLGAAVGILAIHAVERLQPVKLLLNAAQYIAGAAAAALLVGALTGRSGTLPLSMALQPASVTAVALAATLFLLTSTVTVAGMIALTSGASWRATWLRLLPTGATLALGNLALGLLAVVVLDARPWALPALAVPVALLWSASRAQIAATVDRERSAAYVEVEHRLSAAATSEQVDQVLVDAVGRVLGGSAAIWREHRWVTPAPTDGADPTALSSPDALDGLEDSSAIAVPARRIGLVLEQSCVAAGMGDGALVVWSGELGLQADAAGWVERLARSGRVHHARVAAAMSLEQERATLRAVVDGTGDGVLLVGPQGEVQLWNPAMAWLSGVEAEQALGRPVVEVLDGPDASAEGSVWTVDGVHDVQRPATDSVWRISVASVHDGAVAASGPLRVVAVHDVTAERKAAQMRDDMLAVVSHELRTPLTPIKGSAQLLRRRADRLDADRREHLLATIEERADHLARLVDDLLLVGQLSGSRAAGDGPADEARPAVALDRIAAEATAAATLAHPCHPLTTDLAPDVVAPTSARRLRQILDHLLDNACKFSPPGSPVVVRLRRDDNDDAAVLEVADSGRGIPPADLERVFERFVRVEDPLVMTTSGAGLGLYIVRELAHALGGRVSLRSRLGQGTTVTLRLPLRSGGVPTQPTA